MRLFRDLSLAEQEHHLQTATGLIVGNIYRFRPAIHAVPLQRLIKGVPDYGVPIRFSYGQLIRFRDRPSVFRDCLFLVQTRVKREGQFEFVVPLLFTTETPRPT